MNYKIASIFLIFILLLVPSISGFNYQVDEFEKDLTQAPILSFFMIGSIYNVSYEEIMVNETLFKIHSFNCSFVFLLIKVKGYLTMPAILKKGESLFIMEFEDELGMSYYKGFMGENFICGANVYS